MRISTLTFAVPCVISPMLLLPLNALARAGGGGGGDDPTGSVWIIIALISLVLILIHSSFLPFKILGYLILSLPLFFLAKIFWMNQRIRMRKRMVSRALQTMAQTDPRWSEENLLEIAEKMFVALQNAWGSQDVKTMRGLLHPQLCPSWEAQIEEQKKRRENNRMVGLSIDDMRIVDVKNYSDDEKDAFSVCFDASADDQILLNGHVVKSKYSKFREFWTFHWHEGRWQLFAVTQASGWERFASSHIVYERASQKKAV
jgi:hypothetical protein